MGAYINGIGIISPQNTFGDPELPELLQTHSDYRLTCMEPDYAAWIDPKLLRRMSRIIRMGMATALLALKEAKIEKPDAIITGTAFGCLEDTGTFLTKMITNQEQALNPTPFIQSTHNTIGSQVALLLQCLGYNQTYSQRAFSFENALLDALMMTDEQQHILVGGIDEITTQSFEILKRFPAYKEIIQGEGAAYFLLATQRMESTYAEVKNVATFYQPENSDQLKSKITAFLSHQSLTTSDIDLILTGKNGAYQIDKNYDSVTNSLFPNVPLLSYKQLCGEYPTSNAFALWMAAKMLKGKKVPAVLLQKDSTSLPDKINRILIYNQYLGDHHSLLLVEAV